MLEKSSPLNYLLPLVLIIQLCVYYLFSILQDIFSPVKEQISYYELS